MRILNQLLSRRVVITLLLASVIGITPLSALGATVDTSPEIDVTQHQTRTVTINEADMSLKSAVNAADFGYDNKSKPSQTLGTKTSSVSAAGTAVAVLTVFSDPTYSAIGNSDGSFNYNTGRHSFITVRNVSSSNITTGWFAIAPGRTITLGLWGNKSEHVGLWYSLESVFVNRDGAYNGRISASYILTASDLSRLNSYIMSHDMYNPVTYNCSSFAVGAWNNTVASSYQLSAGIPNTPKNLANSIKSKFVYTTNGPVPYYYLVYYAQGYSAPIKSLYWQW